MKVKDARKVSDLLPWRKAAPKTPTGVIEIDRTKTGRREFYWRLKAPNGEIVSGGEGHPTKWNARRAARDAQSAFRDPVWRDLT